MPNGLSSVLWFCAIVALIPVSLWFLKRTPLGGGAGAGVMKSVAMLPLSTSQRIVTVEVGSGDERRWLVLGVTPASITTLHTMAPQEIASAPAPGAVHPAFAQILGRFQRNDAGGTADAR
ncbi:MAG: flagellar biosynthetic protein FliO [Rhizobacter sp.]|nr:flagellar biosynthetic protein FliO [Rhizobacter sp.]